MALVPLQIIYLDLDLDSSLTKKNLERNCVTGKQIHLPLYFKRTIVLNTKWSNTQLLP